ncbi:MAG: type I methionyl aminopeptidase [Chitinophagales bacterium]|nr:type I methionyl aminopeptidase [Chitinophagales bacterium]
MIIYKTNDEVELIRISSLLVSETLALVASVIKPGMTTLMLDKIADEYIMDNGAIPAFKGYKSKTKGIRDFPCSLCISVNEVVVHGIPSKREIIDGDVISVDCGVLKNGFFGDSAYSFLVGEQNMEVVRLAKITKAALQRAIDTAQVGNRIGDISFAIQNYTEYENGYGVVRELVGHGIGKNLHEEPEVPNCGTRGRGPKLLEGLVIAVEPMINLGTKNVVQENDGWTIRTKDYKPSVHFEHTIAIKRSGPDVLSSFEPIEKAESQNINLYKVKDLVTH